MSHKENINKVHYLLTENFDNVEIKEDANRTFGNHVVIKISETLDLNLVIEKLAIENDKFRWFYLTDPRDEDSFVERISNTETFTKDVREILDKEMFRESYVKSNSLKKQEDQ